MSDEIRLAGELKLNEMIEKSAAANGYIDIQGSDFEKFITRGPRPYYSLVILTALSSGNCQPCEQLNPAIQELAGIVEEQRAKIADSRPNDVDIFVVNADFANNRNVFQKLGLSTAPMVVLVPPSKSRKEIPLSKFFKSISQKYQYSLTQGRSAQDVGEWMASAAKAEWIELGSTLELPEVHYVAGVVVVVPMVLYALRKAIDKLRRSMFLYAVISMAAYSFIIGGGMFSSIRNTPWLHKDGNRVGYISHQSRYQFGVETYIVGGFNFVGGMAAFVLIMAQRSGTPEIRAHKYFKWFQYVPTVIPLMSIAAAWYGIMWCYNFKNGHYNMGHVGMTG